MSSCFSRRAVPVRVVADDVDAGFLSDDRHAPDDSVTVALVAEDRLPELVVFGGDGARSLLDRVQIKPAGGARATLTVAGRSLEAGVAVETEVGVELEKAE